MGNGSRPGLLAGQLAALRALLVLTLVTGLAYPLAVSAVAQLPGLSGRADGSLVEGGSDGRVVGSALIGQSFTGADGTPLPQYLQSRPSAAGAGYDPTASGASNLGPQDVVDTLPDPATGTPGRLSLLTQVCARSAAVGALEGVDGSRPFCTRSGAGAVLGVVRAGGPTGPVTRVVSLDEPCPATPFVSTWEGVEVACAIPGGPPAGAVVTPVRGDAPAVPAVPPDAVTASGSGLDPAISPAYAALQVPRLARVRELSREQVSRVVAAHTDRPLLGFLGAAAVDVLAVNLGLDRLQASG